MKNKYPRLLVVLCALMIGLGSLWAERVTQEDAALVAANFLNAGDTTSQGAQAPGRNRPIRRVALSEEAQYYVYANADGEGWVMVAANDVVQPILAYSETGTFRTVNMPSNVKSWMGGYNKQINYAEANGLEATEETKAEWTALRKGARKAKAAVVVSPLIKTGWDQDEPYWNLCPSKNSNRCYTGCVATAMAQVMNYHQWPKTGTGSHSLTYNGKTYTANFGETTYDWANMKNTYSSSSSSTSKTAVATLMYHCGIAVDMSYGTSSEGGSAAYTIDFNGYFTRQGKMCAETALTTFFGYNSSTVTGYYRNGDNSTGMKKWTESEWIAMLKEELNDSRPIMYAGGDSQGETGHSFVCDGYDSDNKFHFNWGWGNYCDGYYSVNSLVPAASGSGGGNGDYSYDQDVIIGIMPPQVGHNVVLNGTGCTLVASTKMVENGNSLNVTITPTDETYDHSSITVKLGNTTLTETTHYTLSNDKKTLTILASAISGSASDAITITAVWTKNRYSYEFVSQDCTVPADGAVSKNAELNLTITPSSGYTLADAACWEVEMGGVELVYGTGFTYTGTTFNIPSVTGDVVIMANALHPVTWYADGNALHAKNVAVDGKITLPATDPANCASGKVFVGWCTESNYSNATTAPTFAKTGDTYSVATYYAVYATDASGSAPRRATMASGDYELVEAAPSDWSGDYLIAYSSEVFADGRTGGTNGIGKQNSSVNPGTNLSGKVVAASWGDTYKVTIEASSTEGKYLLKTQDGAYNYQSSNVNGCASTITKATAESYPLSIAFNSSSDIAITVSSTAFHYNTQGYFRFYKNAGQSAIYLYKKVSSSGGSGGGGSYTDYSTACGTPCSNTPTMFFDNGTVNKTTDDETYTQAVNISGKGSGQTVAYSSSDETVATVNNSGVVTLKGKIGSTTITASVAADGDYCAALASYTLNVSAAPISVTLHYYDNQVTTLNNQQSPYTLPTTGSYVADACDGDWTFDGWYGSTYTKNTQKPTYITELTTDGSAAYAVYKTTETSGSGGNATNLIEYNGVDGRSTLEAIEGVTTNSVADYAAANSPYLLKFDGTGDYIQFELSVVPTSLSFEYKMIGGANTSTMTIMECATATGDYTDVEALSISGSQNSTGSLTTSNSFSKKFVRMVFTKGSNVGVGSITIVGGGSSSVTYYATTPECVTGCTITPTMSFANEAVTKTTDDEAYVQYVTIENKGDGQTVAYSSSNETVATVSNLGGVTLKGVVGSTTITASVAADGEYCAASASYTITVEACALTGITLNTDNAKTVFLVGEQLTTAGVVVTANYSNCEDKIVEPDGFTYPGNITMEPGTKQVTAHYAEASATYDVTVVAPYTVTWKACGEVFDTQTYAPGATLVLPSSTPGGNAGKSFVGWTATVHYTGASAPPDLFDTAGGKTVTGNATYYAVYE